MAAAEKVSAGPPASLGDLFASKPKKKPKATNLNAYQPPPEPVAAWKPRQVAAEGDIEGWERALRNDQELLKACKLWIKDMDADGACLFRAFSDQLAGDGGTSHSEYRERCVDFLEQHRADFEPFLEEEFGAYCDQMRRPTTWGGHVEVQALARALGVNAVIYQPAEAARPSRLMETSVEMFNAGDEARCVQLSFHPTHHAGQHYNSVRCAEDDGDGVPPALSHGELKRRVDDALRPPPVVEQVAPAPAAKPKRGAFARMTASAAAS